MTSAVGPVYVASAIPVKVNDGQLEYNLVYYPDLNNDQLQREGQAPHYYYMPRDIHIARDLRSGDYMFSLLHFEGVMSGETNVGVQGEQEVTGGLFTVSITAGLQPGVLQSAHDQFLNSDVVRGGDFFFGRRSSAAPIFGPVPIRANMVGISNISPIQNRSFPAVVRNRASGNWGAPTLRPVPLSQVPLMGELPAPGRDGANLDMWYANLTGQGPGAVDLEGVNALAGLLGKIPTALLFASFHGAYGGVVISEALKLPFWAPAGKLDIVGSWDRIFNHFSAAGHVGGFFWGADVQVEFNNLVTSGDIQVTLTIDETIPGADKIRDQLMKTSDLVYQSFMDKAQKIIFDPAPPNVEPAHASGGFLGLGGGFALKERRDESELNLEYHETLNTRFLQDDVISSNLSGFYDEIKRDPNAEKKYFPVLYLSDWDRKVTRYFKAVANWPDPGKKWVGQPVAFLSAQVGYPDAQGNINWAGHTFQPTDPPDASWTASVEQKRPIDVSNPPQGWAPAKTFVKRTIHFLEPPGEAEYPLARVQVEKNLVDLDPGPNGTLTDVINQEIRVDSAGTLSVGPISLNVDLESAKQEVEVSFQALGTTASGQDRPIEKLLWTFADQNLDRYWMVYTGQLDFQPRYRYQVRVVIRGSLVSQGREWTGPWVEAAGNGPFIVRVPASDDPDVVSRALPMGVSASQPGLVAGNDQHPQISGHHGAPPPARPGAGARRPPPSRSMSGTAYDQPRDAGDIAGYYVGQRSGEGGSTGSGESGAREAGGNGQSSAQNAHPGELELSAWSPTPPGADRPQGRGRSADRGQ
jgi:hypothetical protein